MRTRAQRQQGFASVKQNLLDAGVAVLNAAAAQEQLFDASVQALAEAVGVEAQDSAELDASTHNSSMNPIVETLIVLRQEAEVARNFEGYVDAEQKLQTLDELEVVRLEREARKLEAQLRITNAQRLLSLPSQTINPTTSEPTPLPNMPESWTESKLKDKFKTLNGVRKAFNIEAKTWKEAVDLANHRQD